MPRYMNEYDDYMVREFITAGIGVNEKHDKNFIRLTNHLERLKRIISEIEEDIEKQKVK